MKKIILILPLLLVLSVPFVSLSEAEELAQSQKMEKEKDFEAGDFHYGLLLKKID